MHACVCKVQEPTPGDRAGYSMNAFPILETLIRLSLFYLDRMIAALRQNGHL